MYCVYLQSFTLLTACMKLLTFYKLASHTTHHIFTQLIALTLTEVRFHSTHLVYTIHPALRRSKQNNKASKRKFFPLPQLSYYLSCSSYAKVQVALAGRLAWMVCLATARNRNVRFSAHFAVNLSY